MSPVLVAVSGGIDSLVTARLLQEEGQKIRAVHFLTGYQSPSIREEMDILAQRLGCPVEILDLSDLFHRTVIRDFVGAYQAGRTPNPCLVCNAVIKFGALMDAAANLGCSAVATGHYARILPADDGGPGLFRGLDAGKDQSYFLSRIPRSRLNRIRFPLGGWTKEAVRQRADQAQIAPLSGKESQDICFLPDGGYADFLEASGHVQTRPGPIVTPDGKIIGQHQGLHRYTIGQRRGLGCPGPAPYHVLALDTSANRLVVGFKDALLASGCRVHRINWLISKPAEPLVLTVKIRYRHRDVAATLTPLTPDTALVRFETPQSAVTPGQGAVFYENDRVLGGGFIDQAEPLKR